MLVCEILLLFLLAAEVDDVEAPCLQSLAKRVKVEGGWAGGPEVAPSSGLPPPCPVLPWPALRCYALL